MPARPHSGETTTIREYNDVSADTTAAGPPSLVQRGILPSALQSSVPSCAQSCLDGYITQQYSGCQNNVNIDCVCSSYSSEGYTLGELAFICLQEDCSTASQAELQKAYRICAAEASAVSATHSTLTLPATATSTSTSGVTTTTIEVFPKSSTSPTSARSGAGTTALSSSSQSSAKTAQSESPATTPAAGPVYPSSSTSTPTASSAAAAAHTATNLTSAQAVGVSVAAFGGLALLMVAIWLCACLRRRKAVCKSPASKHSSYGVVDDAPPRFSPFRYGYADPRGPLGGIEGRRVELPGEKRARSQWYMSHFPDQHSSEKLNAPRFLGHLSTPQMSHGNRSNETLRTLSQLLPDKPGETPPRPSQKQFPLPPSLASPETLFEEYRNSRAASIHTPKMPRLPLPIRPSGLPGKDIGPRPQYAPQYTKSPEKLRQPTLSLQVPVKTSAPVMKVPSPIAILPPPPSIRTSRGDRRSRSSKAKSSTSSKSSGSLLDYYASPEINVPTGPLNSPLTPISFEPQRRTRPMPAAITVTRPTHPPRAARRPSGESMCSDTSFESTDPDEPTPPEEDKQLSPVVEHSPIAAVRYPKVPRSSNQAIPRTPPVKFPSPISPKAKEQRGFGRDDRALLPSHARQASRDHQDPKTPEPWTTVELSLSGTTLLAKRRGDTVAHDLENGLQIDSARAGSHAKPGGSADARSNANTPPRMPASKTARQESPLKGYGRVTSAGSGGRPSRQSGSKTTGYSTPEMKDPSPKVARYRTGDTGSAQQAALKSPLWEPKLTPSRRGADLYLEVGVNSPGRKAAQG